MRHEFPTASKGMVIGLLGGSFDPAHQGHVHITREALKRLGLDQVWWLVSPGNPLKPRPPAEISRRLTAARRALKGHPRVVVTDLERHLGTRYTADTLARLRALYPGVRFVWLMGADNLASFHRWDRWHEIMATTAVAVFARPEARLRGQAAPAARRFKNARCPRPDQLARATLPAWTYIDLPLNAASSSQIRAEGGWPATNHPHESTIESPPPAKLSEKTTSTNATLSQK